MSKQAFVSTEGFRYGYFTRSKSDPQLSLCITGFVLGSGWKVLFCIGPEWMEPSGAQAKIWGLGSYSNHPRGPFRWQVAHTQMLLIFSQRQGGQGSLAGREENWPKMSLANVCLWPIRSIQNLWDNDAQFHHRGDQSVCRTFANEITVYFDVWDTHCSKLQAGTSASVEETICARYRWWSGKWLLCLFQSPFFISLYLFYR